MKKLLYSLSAALVCSLGSMAATPQLSQSNIKGLQISATELQKMGSMQMKAVPVEKKSKKVGRQATAQDFIGTYQFTYYDMLQNSNPLSTLTIKASATNPDQLEVVGMMQGITLNGYVSDGKLIIPNEYLFDDEQQGDQAWFWNFYLQLAQLEGDEQYFDVVQGTSDTPFYFTMQDDGSLLAGAAQGEEAASLNNEQLRTMTCVATIIPVRLFAEDPVWFYFSAAWMNARPLELFSYVPDEWEYVGDAEFYDAWFKGFWSQSQYEPTVYEVPLYENKADKYRFMLLNPYGPETPYVNVNENLDKEGYLVFTIENPNCVAFEPFVYSITISDTVLGGDGS